MGFLAPALLALGAAIAVPILLHLLQRQQGPRVVFPAIRYLRRAEQEHARRIRLRQWLLLVLRVLAILLIAAAAARPFIASAGGGHRPTAVVIVLDNSLSSGTVAGDRRVLDELKERALATLAAAGADDRFWLLRAATPTEAAFAGDPAAVAARLRETDVVPGGARLGEALERAAAILAAGAEGRAAEIHLLSDLQATALPASTPGTGELPLLAWLPDREPPPNAGVTAVVVDGGLAPRAGQPIAVAARVEGAGRDSLRATLYVDERPRDAAVGPPGAELSFTASPRGTGALGGWVEVDADALRGDDRRYVAAWVTPAPAVAVAAPAPFIDEALDVLAGAGRIRRTSPASAEVVLAPGAVGAEAAARSGHAVVVLPPAEVVEVPAANRRLAAAGVSWRFGPPAAGGEARFADGIGDTELTAALRDARLRQVFPLEPAGDLAGDTVLIRLADGAPWAVKGRLAGGGAYLVVASPLSNEATTIPTSTGLLPLLDRMVGEWVRRGAVVDREAEPGHPIPLPATATAVVPPTGDRIEVEGGSLFRPALAGIHRVLAGDSVLDVFAANPPAGESMLARPGERELRQRLGGFDVRTAEDAEAWSEAIFRSRLGYEAWPWLLGAALLLLLVESLVAATGRLRAAPAEAVTRTTP